MKVETTLAKERHSIFTKLFCMLSPSKQIHPKPTTLEKPQELNRLIDFFDENGDGKISPAELQNCVKIIGVDLSSEDAEDFVQSVDSDGDGHLCFDEFVKIARVDKDEEKRKYLLEAFRVYEMDGENCITPKSLRRALERIGHQAKSVEECKEMIRRYDINGDGVICFEEFEIMML